MEIRNNIIEIKVAFTLSFGSAALEEINTSSHLDLHFIDKKIEAKRGKVTFQRPYKLGSRYQNLGLPVLFIDTFNKYTLSTCCVQGTGVGPKLALWCLYSPMEGKSINCKMNNLHLLGTLASREDRALGKHEVVGLGWDSWP